MVQKTAKSDRLPVPRRMFAQSFVEVAFVLPLLVLAGVGVIQFSLWMHAEGVVTAAVQDGARIASTETGTLEQGTAVAQALMRDGLGPNAAFVQLVPSQDASTVRFEASGSLPAIIPGGATATIPTHASPSIRRDPLVP